MKKKYIIILILFLILIPVFTGNQMKEFYDYNLNKSYYQIVTDLPEQEMRNLNFKIVGINDTNTSYDNVVQDVLQAYPNDYIKNIFVKNTIYEDKYMVAITYITKRKINNLTENNNILVIKNLGETSPFTINHN
jgi:hypothetical protein